MLFWKSQFANLQVEIETVVSVEINTGHAHRGIEFLAMQRNCTRILHSQKEFVHSVRIIILLLIVWLWKN